jgi:WD40 repeat protein
MSLARRRADSASLLGTIVSPYRHIYGEPSKAPDSYNDVLVSTAQVDTNMLAANARFVAVPWETRGGGAFAVLKAGGKGRLGGACPLFEGHKAGVIDVAFNPFNDFVVASASDDATIKLWQVTEAGGQVQGTKECYASLSGHSRKAARIVFNPLVDNALASFGAENAIKLWDISKGSAVSTIKGVSSAYLDISWSQDGNRLVLPAKDKKLHAFDVRAGTEIWSSPNHPGLKGSRAVFYDKLNYVCTTGYGQSSARQVAVRDTRNPETPLKEDDIDYNAGMLMAFVDPDAGVVYLFGRGDTSTRYYELRDQPPELLSLSQFALSEPIRAVAHAPKYAVNTDACELDRFYVVTQSKALIQLQMIVPRRNSEGIFQDDLYPPTVGPEASIDFDSWKAGEDAVPKTVSLEGGVQLAAGKEVQAVLGDDPEALRAEIARLQARVTELEALLAAK